MKLLTKYKNSKVYNMFYTYVNKKYNYNIGILDDKHFAIQLGLIIDFLYDIGYEIFASKEGYKITTHNPNNTIKAEIDREYKDISVKELFFVRNSLLNFNVAAIYKIIPQKATTIDNFFS
jgi:hypothetical protein